MELIQRAQYHTLYCMMSMIIFIFIVCNYINLCDGNSSNPADVNSQSLQGPIAIPHVRVRDKLSNPLQTKSWICIEPSTIYAKTKKWTLWDKAQAMIVIMP